MQVAIRVHEVGKSYRVYDDPYGRLLEKLPGNGRLRHRLVPALSGVTFEVAEGSCLGLIGGNGSGKSTLLKLLAGNTLPSAGHVRIRGRVTSLLELGAGFHRAFTGRENILMNASILGMSRREATRKLEEIIEFSELADFIDLPIRTYSAGMVCRLAFSTATAMDPEILLVDEVLAVGDLHFQEKSMERIQRFRDRGVTIVLASHSLYLVRQICDQALWLRAGRVAGLGDPVAVTNDYATYEHQLGIAEPGVGVAEALPSRHGPRIVAVELIDATSGGPRHVFAPNDDTAVRIEIENTDPPRALSVGVAFFRQEGLLCCAHSTGLDGVPCTLRRGFVTLRLPRVRFLSGEYTVMVALLDESGVQKLHELTAPRNLIVQSRTKDVGLFLHEHEWSVEPCETAEKRA